MSSTLYNVSTSYCMKRHRGVNAEHKGFVFQSAKTIQSQICSGFGPDTSTEKKTISVKIISPHTRVAIPMKAGCTPSSILSDREALYS